jgi:Lipocalin-like domain
MKKSAMFFLALIAASGAAFAQSPPRALQGTWQSTEVITPGPNGPTTVKAQSSLYIFTAKHYSIAAVTSAEPRPDLPTDIRQATAAELLATWFPYTSNSGTYEVSGDTVTMRPMVAKNPAVMKAGNYFVNSFKVEGNTLSLTVTQSVNGPVANAPTIKLKRLE